MGKIKKKNAKKENGLKVVQDIFLMHTTCCIALFK